MTLFNRDKPQSAPASQQKPSATQTPRETTLPPQPQTRSESAAPKPQAEVLPPLPVKPTIQPSTPSQTSTIHSRTGATMASVISKALKITGELESTEDIQIDGQIEGDVRGVGVKIGQNARVKGTVYGDEVELAGTIEGRIEAKKVILAGTARMTGDICHQDIKIESGAYINGSLKPELNKADGKPVHKPAGPSASVSTAGVSPGNGNATAAAH
ncbi:MAG TPA: polymer-forming cytoskeletal protein [Rhizomicrobium sp.]|nr:polymer-forming cytoskeletal protein [Rhizomicrobium sp.]